MNNFRNSGPGGLRKRPEFIGGRPSSDANYGPKKSFDKKPSFGGKAGFKGGDRGGSRGGDRGGFGGNKGGFGGSRDGERREVTMHKATCSTCSKPCEVPFRPDGSKPVLCSECFGKNKSDDRNGFERRDRFSNDRPQRGGDRKFDAPRPERGPSPDMKALESKVSALESKVDEILSLLKGEAPAKKKVVKETASPEETVTVVSDIKKAAKKVAEPKKASPVKKVAKKAVAKKPAAKKVAKKVVKKK